MEDLINIIEELAVLIPNAGNVEELMGVEGRIRSCYYDAFNLIINDFLIIKPYWNILPFSVTFSLIMFS